MALDDNTVDSDTTFKRDVNIEGELLSDASSAMQMLARRGIN